MHGPTRLAEDLSMTSKNPKVDALLDRQTQWKSPMEELRRIALDAGLSEDVKWGSPCYTDGGRNIALIQGFKAYCALLFFKGALLPDPSGLLTAMTENVQSARQFRCVSVSDVTASRQALQDLLRAAIDAERSGAKVVLKTPDQFEVPSEFQSALDANPALRTAFESLTPGRRRAYLLHFSQTKQSSTRTARIAKNASRILEGKGLDD